MHPYIHTFIHPYRLFYPSVLLWFNTSQIHNGAPPAGIRQITKDIISIDLVLVVC